ncbi:Na+/H+ antiporter NhaA [Pseudomonadota bacterium]
MITQTIQNFLKKETAGGILLVIAAAIALICANSPLAAHYGKLLSITGELRIENFSVEKPVLLWINDLWMAIFFFLVGLELKRELVEGELSDRSQLVLPVAGAIGGMAVPAAFYIYFNYGDPVAMNGWAIPAATDIAFALGILALLGSRVPIALKIFLTSLAIIDDIGAIVIIAIFYSGTLSQISLLISAACIIVLYILNRRGVADIPTYLFVGTILWLAVLMSGVHATLAGVLLAFFIPLSDPKKPDFSPAKYLEHSLHPIVAFFILPVFAFANAGVSLHQVSLSSLLNSVPLGIASGLFIGKQLGIFLACWLVVIAGLVKLPQGMNWKSLYGASILCGIGFTMSLFIGGLAFEQSGGGNMMDDRIGILTGSLLSGIVGYFYLHLVLPKRE